MKKINQKEIQMLADYEIQNIYGGWLWKTLKKEEKGRLLLCYSFLLVFIGSASDFFPFHL